MNEIISEVKFIRKYVYSMGEKYSKFRGKGKISFGNECIIVTGKRIYKPMILRAVIVIFIAISFVLIFKVSQLFWFFVLIFYYLIQYVFLKKENLSLQWAQIDKYEIDIKKKIISFSIENNPACSPVVFITEQFEQIADKFREKMKDRERTSHGWKAVDQRYDEQTNSMSKRIDRWLGGNK